MTQQIRIYLLQTLLLCLLFKPIVCYSNEYFNTRQIPSPNFDTHLNINYDDVENRRNFEYHPYQPHYASPQLHQLQYQRRSDEAYREQTSEDSQNMEYKIQQRSVTTQAPIVPLPYQGKTEEIDNETNLEEKIRSIFIVGTDHLKLFNTTLNPKLSTISIMHANESLISNNKNASESSSIQSSLTTRTTELALQSSKYTPTISSSSLSSLLTSVNKDEPSFKVQRKPDGKLSLVFNDTLSLQNRTALTRQNSSSRPDIIFPGTPLPTKIAFNGCEEFEGETLCKKTRGYPNLSKLDSRGLAEHSIFFTEDVEPPLNISQRFGGDPDEINPCKSVEEYIFPEGGETADSRWLFIVQNQGAFKQRVRIEKCIGNNRPCENIEENLPNNLLSICKQSYVYRALVAVDNNTYVKEQFKIPSCCKCILRRKSVNF